MKHSTTTRLALRNTLRRRTRTLLTAGMVVCSVALLLVALSWLRGIFGTLLTNAAALDGHVRIVTRPFAAHEELLPLYENIADTSAVQKLLLAQPHVREVQPRIITGVTVTVGEEIGDVLAPVIGGSLDYFRDKLAAKDKLLAGRFFSGADDEVIAGAKLVEELGAKLGDELVMLGMTQDGSLSSIKAKLVGIVNMGGGRLDQQAFVPLSRVQYLTDIPEGATELLVYAERFEDAAELAGQLSALPALKDYDVRAWSQREPWKTITGTMGVIEGIIVSVVVFLTALGIWNTMMMSVLERTHEIGVLRALGLSRWGTVRMFVGEALAIALVGGLAGLALGAYPAWWLEKYGLHLGSRVAASSSIQITETVYGQLTWSSAGSALGLGMLMALLGSLVPALRASSIEPVSAMKSGR